MITPIPPIEQCSPGGDVGPFVIGGKSIIPWQAMVEQYDCEWFCCQGGIEDPDNGYSSITNFTEGRKWLEIIGGFYWLKPAWSIKYMVDRYSDAIYKEDPAYVWIDAEEHNDGVTEYPPAQIADRGWGVYEGLHANFPEKRLTFYSRPDFMRTYAPGLLPLLATLDHISWAAWPDYGLDPYYELLADIYAGIMRECLDPYGPKPRPWKTINIFDGAHGPDLTLSPQAAVWFWQHSSRLRPKEYQGQGLLYDHGYDWDRANITHAQMLRWIKFLPLEETPPEPVLTLESLDAELSAVKAQMASMDARLQKIESLPWYRQFFPIIQK